MNAIFAVNQADGFGTGTGMPWPRSKVDLERFRMITWGSTVVMGRGTWESDMPKPLPNRRNCVLSHTLEDDRCEVFRGVQELMLGLQQNEHVWVIGGAKVLWTLRPYINKIHLTRFADKTASTVYFDTADYLDEFQLWHRQELDDHTFETWIRKG